MHAPRIVLRSTLFYGLRMSDALLSAAPADQSEIRPYLSVGDTFIYEAESRAIERLYVPRFVMPPGTQDVAIDSNGARVRNMFHASGADCIRRRLEQLSLAELDSILKTALLAQML